MSAGLPVVALGDVGSTNDEAMARLGDGDAAVWVTGVRQLKGRGRRGRTWVSEPGNLYASFAFAPDWPSEIFGILPLGAAVALGSALQGLGLDARLKWPNDVLLAGRKCAGILIEAEYSGATRRVVVGFGVNVAHHPDEGLMPATALQAHDPAITPAAVFDLLRPALGEVVETLGRPEGVKEIRTRWLARAVGIGRDVVVRYDTQTVEGRFVGLDPAGRLILATPSGTRLIAAGDVFVRTEPL